jgi:hypothetical protein
MRNYVVGQTYHNATVHAEEAQSLMKTGRNPAGLSSLVEQRPQGRQFLYAQVAKSRAPDTPPSDYTIPTYQSASLPELSFRPRRFVDRKTFSEEVPPAVRNGTQKVPGYTGHMHASQHVYGQSFGRTARDLVGGGLQSTRTSLRVAEYIDDKPQGLPLQGDGTRIPGYTGCIRAKDNYVYGHTFANATRLSLAAVKTMQEGGPVSALPELTDARPQGAIDLFSQRVAPGPVEYIDRPSKVPLHLAIRANKFAYTKKHGLQVRFAAGVMGILCFPGEVTASGLTLTHSFSFFLSYTFSFFLTTFI